MTLVIDILSRVARRCSLPVPGSWVTADDLGSVQLRDDYLHETADEVLRRIDWASPVGAQVAINGDGSSTYSLPSTFKRLQAGAGAVYEDPGIQRAGIPIPSDPAWTAVQSWGAGGDRYFRVTGYDGNWEISFYPALETGETATVSYIGTQWIADSGGTAKDMLTEETDVAMLPRRLLECGTIKRFRESKGLDAGPEGAEYQQWLMDAERRAHSIDRINFGGAPCDMTSPDDWPLPRLINQGP